MADGAAVLQHQIAGGLFKAQITTHVEEVAHRDLHRTGRTDQRTLVAIHIQAAGRARARKHLHRLRPKVHHQLAGVLCTAGAKDLVGFYQQVLGLQRQGVTAHKTHLIGRNFQAHPTQAAQIERVLLELIDRSAVAGEHRDVLRAEQRQGELGIRQHKAACRRVRRIAAVDHAIAVAVHMVGTAHAHKGVKLCTAHGQAVHQYIRAIGQRDGGG